MWTLADSCKVWKSSFIMNKRLLIQLDWGETCSSAHMSADALVRLRKRLLPWPVCAGRGAEEPPLTTSILHTPTTTTHPHTKTLPTSRESRRTTCNPQEGGDYSKRLPPHDGDRAGGRGVIVSLIHRTSRQTVVIRGTPAEFGRFSQWGTFCKVWHSLPFAVSLTCARTNARTQSDGESIIMRPALSNCLLFSLCTLPSERRQNATITEHFQTTGDFSADCSDCPNTSHLNSVTLWALKSSGHITLKAVLFQATMLRYRCKKNKKKRNVIQAVNLLSVSQHNQN